MKHVFMICALGVILIGTTMIVMTVAHKTEMISPSQVSKPTTKNTPEKSAIAEAMRLKKIEDRGETIGVYRETTTDADKFERFVGLAEDSEKLGDALFQAKGARIRVWISDRWEIKADSISMDSNASTQEAIEFLTGENGAVAQAQK